MTEEICQNCVLPGTFPGIEFDGDGICNYCRLRERNPIDFSAIRAEAEAVVRNAVGTGPSYDIVLAFSGGKDSTYTLKYLREFGARIIAITIDNDFMSEAARKNCSTVTSALGVDHIVFRPNPRAMMNIYNTSLNKEIYSSAALKRATPVCNSCIQVINTQILNFAANYQVPIVAGGYLGGQIPAEAGFMKQKFSLTRRMRASSLKQHEGQFSDEALRLFAFNGDGPLEQIHVINPMAYLNISEEQILDDISQYGWVRPADTGQASTNCLLNDYAIAHHQKKYGFHPYIAEIATMVRRGTINREQGLKKAMAHIDTEHFGEVEGRLGRFE